MDSGRLARSNAGQVRAARPVVESLVMTFATPGETRVTLNLKGGDRISFLQVFGKGGIPRRESWGDARGLAKSWSGTQARNIGCPHFLVKREIISMIQRC